LGIKVLIVNCREVLEKLYMMVQIVSKLSYPVNCEKKKKGIRIVLNIKLHSTPERIKDAKKFNCQINNLIDSIIQINKLPQK
jgi:hypothetical protein